MSLFPAHCRSLRRPAVATALIATAALVAMGLPAHASATAATMAGPAGVSGWLPVASPPAPPANDAGSISALAPTGPESAWAVGADQYTPSSGYPTLAPVAYQWNGGRWVSTPIASPAASEGFGSVADGGAGDVWAVGAQTDNPQVDPYQPRIRHWDGSAWQVTPFPGDTETTDDLQLNQVAAAGGKAWIAALDGVNGGILSWDGTSWALQQISSAYELWGVTAIGAADAWTVGYSSNSSTLALHWNGTVWQDESPANQTVNLQDVAASGPGNVWAAGIYYDSDGTGPYLAADHWNGTSWTEYPIPDLPGMEDYVFPLGLTVDNSGRPWIAAYSNRADRTAYFHWNGSAWQVSYGVSQPGVIESYSDALATLPDSGTILSAGTSTRFATLSRSYAELNPVPSASSQFTAVPASAARTSKTASAKHPGTAAALAAPSIPSAPASSATQASPGAPAVPAIRYGAPLSVVRVPGPHGAIPGSKALPATPTTSATSARSSATSVQPARASARAAPSSTAAPPVTTAATWAPATLPPMPPQDSLNGVAATTGGIAWAVGEQYQGLIAPGDPLVLQSAGDHWIPVPLPAVRWQGSLTGVAAVSPTDAWAIGTDVRGNPHILHGSGGIWTDVPFPGSTTAGVTLTAIAAAPGVNPWAAENGPNGPVLLHWTGSRWASQAAPPGDTSLSTLTVHSTTDVWAAGYAPDPADAYQSLVAVSHWNGSAWTTLSTAGTAQWDVASVVAAGPDDVWISGGVWPFPPFLGELPAPLLAHWNGTSWTRAALPLTLGFLPSLTAAPSGQPAWASVEPYLWPSGVTIPQGSPVFLTYNGSAWTLSFGPATTPELENPETHLAAVPGTTQTLAAGTAPYLLGTHEPLIETHGG
jgi:hypothetical protein